MGWLELQIETRLGGYRHPMNQVDESLPHTPSRARRVAVVGAGLESEPAVFVMTTM